MIIDFLSLGFDRWLDKTSNMKITYSPYSLEDCDNLHYNYISHYI